MSWSGQPQGRGVSRCGGIASPTLPDDTGGCSGGAVDLLGEGAEGVEVVLDVAGGEDQLAFVLFGYVDGLAGQFQKVFGLLWGQVRRSGARVVPSAFYPPMPAAGSQERSPRLAIVCG